MKTRILLFVLMPLLGCGAWAAKDTCFECHLGRERSVLRCERCHAGGQTHPALDQRCEVCHTQVELHPPHGELACRDCHVTAHLSWETHREELMRRKGLEP